MEFLDSFRRKKKDSKSTANSKQSGEVYYEKGSFIGQKYEVYGEVGHGGFGIVYKVYSHETKSVFALKTFKDEYLEDAETRKLFRREANVWVELERHSYVVRAYFVEKVAGRLYIGMEYIAKDEQGRNTLQDYLTHQPPDLAQSLRWAVQFCYGIEYAYSKGVRCHRDIKPSNIMISTDKTVKITDFGLAGVLGASKAMSGVRLSIQQGRVGLSGSIMEGRGCGTPTHMPPEQFTDAASCDQRSDIYAFGVVLYQMAAGDRLPFVAALPKDNSQEEQRRFWKEMYKLHNQALVPKLNSPLFSIIQRCLEKQPTNRYQTFKELRADLEPLLRSQTGETIKPPESKHLEAWEWLNKGTSLQHLGRSVEALECYDKALEINPQDAEAWHNKGIILYSLGHFEEVIKCCDKAIEINPQHASAWSKKGMMLVSLGRSVEALQCFERALEINPQHALTWIFKGTTLESLGRSVEALECYDKALEINPQDVSARAVAWNYKACVEDGLGRKRDAARSFRKFIELAPDQYAHRIENARQRLQELGGK